MEYYAHLVTYITYLRTFDINIKQHIHIQHQDDSMHTRQEDLAKGREMVHPAFKQTPVSHSSMQMHSQENKHTHRMTESKIWC